MLKKFLTVVAIAAVFVCFKALGWDQYLTFEYIKQNQAHFQIYYAENALATIAVFFTIYTISTGLSIPGATILTLLAGALFGLVKGTIIVSFASTMGATMSFLISRALFQESLHKKYGEKLKPILDGVEKEGAFYLFTLRLVPIFPFFLINLSMGLTKMKTLTFFFVSQIGMFLGTIVYVNAGQQLSSLESLSGIISPALIGSFAVLGFFPIVAKKIVEAVKAKKVYKDYKMPKSFDYNMVAIGAGSAGLVTSYICAAVKAKVALIEKDKMGGDCLNTGCVPSKAIIKSAKVAKTIDSSIEYGIESGPKKVDFKKLMNRVHQVIKEIEPHDSVERYTKLGVDCIHGEATIISPWEVKVADKIYTTKNITIATGASPFIPPIKGIEDIDILTSNNLWNLDELPEKLVVLGGGPIGLEMAQSFSRLGSKVTIIEMGKRVMPKEDEDVSDLVEKFLIKDGVTVLTSHKAVEFIKSDKNIVICDYDSKTVEVEFDKVLIAIGRKANIKGFGLENLNISLSLNGTIETDEYMRTNYPNIFACGDVAGPYQLTHMASHQAWYCAVNALFGKFKKFKVDYSAVPWCTYVDPEVATVGATESVLRKSNTSYEVVKYGIDDLDRAIADSNNYGFVKVLVKPGSDVILGATIVGVNAGELITEFVSAMKNKKGLNTILGTIHSYPTMSEANKYAAGEWKRANAPQKLLEYVAKFHKWMRS